MVAMLFLVLAVVTVFAVVGAAAQLMLSAIWAMGLLALLGWLAVSPDARPFPAAWWALAAWVTVASLRHLPRRYRG